MTGRGIARQRGCWAAAGGGGTRKACDSPCWLLGPSGSCLPQTPSSALLRELLGGRGGESCLPRGHTPRGIPEPMADRHGHKTP